MHAQTPTELTVSLDSLLQANATQELLKTLQKAPDSNELLHWLRARAEEGHVVAQSELAWRLAKHNKREALAWDVLSLINLTLDQNECNNLTKAGRSVRQLIRGFPEKITEAEGLMYADATEEALKIAERHGTGKQGKQPPWWICAPGETSPSADRLKPEETRLLRRQFNWEDRKAHERDTALEIRLNANLNPEHYRIWTLDRNYWEGKLNSRGDQYFSVVWLDNDTLLFGGYEVLQGLGSPKKYDPIYQWDLRSNHIKQYSDPGFGLCHFQGFISYYVLRDGKLLYREGELGKEQEIEIYQQEAKDIQPGLSKVNDRFHCRRFSASKSPHGRGVRALESGGRIKFNGSFSNEKRTAEYFSLGSEASVIFDPFEGLQKRPGDYWLGPVSYSEYLDASWFPIVRGGSLVTSTPLWILRKDGKVVRNDIDPGPWTSSRTTPARGGWFAANANGLYFLTLEKKIKILSERVQGIRVSPNGCRVVAGAPVARGAGEPMWVVDVCKKG